jgi:hypothetical protein
MLVNNIRRTITDPERDAVLVEFAQKHASTGPFREMKFVQADPTRSPAEVLSTAGSDTAVDQPWAGLDRKLFAARA